MTTIQLVTLTAPSFLASYLVNGDTSGLGPGEREACDAWLAANGLIASQCVDAEPVGFTHWHDATAYVGAGDCERYTFHVLRGRTPAEKGGSA